MSEFFLNIFNMSVATSWIILAVLLLRLLLKKAPKWIHVLLWGIVALRLICPFSIESFMSLIPSAETISPGVLLDSPEVHTGFPMLNSVLNPIVQDSSVTLAPEKSVNVLKLLVMISSRIWIFGVFVVLAFMVISYLRVKRKIGTAVLLRANIYQSESVVSPFVLGMIRPKIYLPFSMHTADRENVIAHEQAHIRRKDHIWKPLGFLLLAIHWFNPLMWVGYILLCRDIELACDERVIKEMNAEQRADYSQALLTCSINRRMITACPLAFGEVGVKERVRSVLSYKKPAFWVILVAILVSIVLAFCFLTNPATSLKDGMAEFLEIKILEHHYGGYKSGEFRCADFEVLGTQKDQDQTTVYLWVMYLEYDKVDGQIKEVSGAHIPTAITLKETETGRYEIVEYWEPRDGTYYAEDIKSKFPWHLHAAATNSERYHSEQRVNCDRKAEEYFTSIATVGGAEGPLNGVTVDAESLKAKYPMYFDLNTKYGLEVYVWKETEDSYSCGLLPGGVRGHTQKEIWDLHKNPTSLAEMAVIVCSYFPEITQQDVTVYAIQMPHSGYMYDIAEVQEEVEDLFWTYASSMLLTLDAATFDIDHDGINERCVLQLGPTSGLFTFKFLVYENGRLEYFNIFQSPWMNLRFEENAEGKMLLIGEDNDEDLHFMGMDVIDGTVVISSDDQEITAWGEQGIHSIFAPDVKEHLDTAIASVLSEHYQSEKPDGLLHKETYYWIANESMSGTPLAGNSGHMELQTVYLLVYHARYSVAGEQLTVVESGIVPTALTFRMNENGEYSLEEYWTPREGEEYESDIRAKFPGESAEEVLNPEKYMETLIPEELRNK